MCLCTAHLLKILLFQDTSPAGMGARCKWGWVARPMLWACRGKPLLALNLCSSVLLHLQMEVGFSKEPAGFLGRSPWGGGGLGAHAHSAGDAGGLEEQHPQGRGETSPPQLPASATPFFLAKTAFCSLSYTSNPSWWQKEESFPGADRTHPSQPG